MASHWAIPSGNERNVIELIDNNLLLLDMGHLCECVRWDMLIWDVLIVFLFFSCKKEGLGASLFVRSMFGSNYSTHRDASPLNL